MLNPAGVPVGMVKAVECELAWPDTDVQVRAQGASDAAKQLLPLSSSASWSAPLRLRTPPPTRVPQVCLDVDEQKLQDWQRFFSHTCIQHLGL